MQIKKRIFSGVVCEQEVYFAPTIRRSSTTKVPRIRFKTDAERERHRIEISRRRHTRLFNENFTPASLYSTMTLDDAHEVYTDEEMERIGQNFVRRLKYNFPGSSGFWYYGQGKTTGRYHMHLVTNGIPEEAIVRLWTYGRIFRIEKLRENCRYKHADGQMYDHGADYTGLANYLFSHCPAERKGRRYRTFGIIRRPEEEEPVECRRYYSIEHPPIAPKGYELVDARSTEYGFFLYKYIKKQSKTRGVLEKPCRCVKFYDESRT